MRQKLGGNVALYGQTGIPVRSKIRIKDSSMVKAIFRGKQGLVVYGLADYSDQDYGYGYFVQVDGVNKMVFLEEYMIEIVSYPVPLQNWLRNKIKLLYEIDPKIAYHLAQERNKGTMEGHYGSCYKNVSNKGASNE